MLNWVSRFIFHTVWWSEVGCEWGTTFVYFGITNVCLIPGLLPGPQCQHRIVYWCQKCHSKNTSKISPKCQVSLIVAVDFIKDGTQLTTSGDFLACFICFIFSDPVLCLFLEYTNRIYYALLCLFKFDYTWHMSIYVYIIWKYWPYPKFQCWNRWSLWFSVVVRMGNFSSAIVP